MTAKRLGLLVFLSFGVGAGIWFARSSSAPASVERAAVRASDAAIPAPTHSGNPVARAAATRSPLVGAAFTSRSARLAETQLGAGIAADDPALLSLRVQLQQMCTAVAERDVQVTVGLIPDPERDPARLKLAMFCADHVVDDTLMPAVMATAPYTLQQTTSTEAGVEQARDWLATRDDAFSLLSAAEFLLGERLGPGLPGPKRGDLALSKAIHLAALRRECRRDGGCGADDARTVAYCAHAGCAPGADLERALRDSLPARDWATLVAMDVWYGQQRRGR